MSVTFTKKSDTVVIGARAIVQLDGGGDDLEEFVVGIVDRISPCDGVFMTNGAFFFFDEISHYEF